MASTKLHKTTKITSYLPPSSISAIKNSIKHESDPNRLVSLFQSASSSPLFYGDRLIFKITIQKLSQSHRPDLIQFLLQNQISNPHSPKSEGFLTRIISLYAKSSMPDHAANAFNRTDFPRSDRSLSALLNAFRISGLHARVFDTFEKSEFEFGIAPGIVSCNVVLKSLCEDFKVGVARKVLDEMPQRGLVPDVVSYNTVLNGYLKEGNEEGFEDLVKEISVKNLDANVGTYNCRIAWLCGKRRSFEAEELLDVMVAKGICANFFSFFGLIDGFCNEGNVGAAMRVFRRMEGMKGKDVGGGCGNFKIYVLLLRFLVEKEEFDYALEICELCLNKKLAPPIVAVKGLVYGLIKNSKVKEAKNVVEEMRGAVEGDFIEEWKIAESEFPF